MVTDQASITHATAQAAVEAIKAAVQAMIDTASECSSGARSQPSSAGSKIGGPTLRKLTFDWGSRDKYVELRNFRLEVNNILQSYNVNNTQKIAIVKRLAMQTEPIIQRPSYRQSKNYVILWNTYLTH